MKRVLISGHRGTRVHAVENTAAAFAYCIGEGFDFIEFDVRKTRDGRLVIFHDKNIAPLLGGTGPVEGFSLEELRRFRYADGQRVQTLEELLEQTRGRIRCMLEIKSRGVSRQVIEDVHRFCPDPGEMIIQSFDPGDIAECSLIDPRIPYGLCLGGLGKFPLFRGRTAERFLRRRVGSLPVTWLNLDGPYIYDEFIDAALRRGLRIILGAKEPEKYLGMLERWRVEIINSDDGAALRETLRKTREKSRLGGPGGVS